MKSVRIIWTNYIVISFVTMFSFSISVYIYLAFSFQSRNFTKSCFELLSFFLIACPNTCFRRVEDSWKKKYEPSEDDSKEVQKTNEVCVSKANKINYKKKYYYELFNCSNACSYIHTKLHTIAAFVLMNCFIHASSALTLNQFCFLNSTKR